MISKMLPKFQGILINHDWEVQVKLIKDTYTSLALRASMILKGHLEEAVPWSRSSLALLQQAMLHHLDAAWTHSTP